MVWEPVPLADLVARFLQARGDSRDVITDAPARYFGIAVNDQSLTPGKNARLGRTHFKEWLQGPAAKR